jgi:hypothetical protein
MPTTSEGPIAARKVLATFAATRQMFVPPHAFLVGHGRGLCLLANPFEVW